MLPYSAQFDAAVRTVSRVAVRVDVLAAGVTIASSAALPNIRQVPELLPLHGGSVTADRSQFCRRTLTVEFGSAEVLAPGTATDLLSAYGTELRVFRGAILPSGSPELICLGTFGIQTLEADLPGGTVKITAHDRCRLLQEARFTSARTSDGTSALGQLTTLIREAAPQADIFIDHTKVQDWPLPSVTWTMNRDQAVVDIVTAIGCEVFCDPWGTFVVQPIPDPDGTPVYTVASGPGGVIVNTAPVVARDLVFNGIVASAQSTGTAATVSSGLIFDADPYSPTYWGPTADSPPTASRLTGRVFGQKPKFYDSSLLTSQPQCVLAAQSLLQDQVGILKTIGFGSLVHPAIEPGDVIQVTYPDGHSERHLLDAVTIPLDQDATMTSTRSRIANQQRRNRVTASIATLS